MDGLGFPVGDGPPIHYGQERRRLRWKLSPRPRLTARLARRSCRSGAPLRVLQQTSVQETRYQRTQTDHPEESGSGFVIGITIFRGMIFLSASGKDSSTVAEPAPQSAGASTEA